MPKQPMDHLPGIQASAEPDYSKREDHPQIPDFMVQDNGHLYEVKCTRCDGKFYVDSLLEGYAGTTRPCFHCFKVSYVPDVK